MVNDAVVLLDALGEVGVALDERLHGAIHGGFGVAGHRQQLLPQRVQAHFKMIFHNFKS